MGRDTCYITLALSGAAAYPTLYTGEYMTLVCQKEYISMFD